jgi:hypothetical protein
LELSLRHDLDTKQLFGDECPVDSLRVLGDSGRRDLNDDDVVAHDSKSLSYFETAACSPIGAIVARLRYRWSHRTSLERSPR